MMMLMMMVINLQVLAGRGNDLVDYFDDVDDNDDDEDDDECLGSSDLLSDGDDLDDSDDDEDDDDEEDAQENIFKHQSKQGFKS